MKLLRLLPVLLALSGAAWGQRVDNPPGVPIGGPVSTNTVTAINASGVSATDTLVNRFNGVTNNGGLWSFGNGINFSNSITYAGTSIASLGAIAGGSGYTNGTYTGVPLTGGSGSGAIGTVTVTAGSVSAIVITSRGTGYTTADTLSATSSSIGGTGSGFSVPVSSVGAISGLTNSWIFQDTSIFGIAAGSTTGIISPYQLFINDAVNTGNVGGLVGLNVTDAPTTGHTGGRAAIQGNLAVVGTPAAAPGAAGYIAGSFISRISANLTGTGGSYNGYVGGTFALGGNIYATSGATFIGLINAQENDTTIPIGASAGEKHGLTLVLGAGDAVRAVYDDNALEISSQDGAGTWKTGLMFGGYAHAWSFGTDSTLIGAQVRQTGPTSPSVALNGVDFSSVTFGTGGCAFKTTGFCVDGPTGAVISTGTALLVEAGTGSETLDAMKIVSQNAGVTAVLDWVNGPSSGTNILRIGSFGSSGVSWINSYSTLNFGVGNPPTFGTNGLMSIAAGGEINMASLPTSAGSGGLYTCIDNTGNLYKKSACP